MRGDYVIVRAYGGVPLIRRVWDENKKAIFITNDSQFQLLSNRQPAIEPIGFPREDVFNYDQAFAESAAKSCQNGIWDWNKLRPYIVMIS